MDSFLDEMNATNSNNSKCEILKKYSNDKFIRDILYYTYNPMLQFGVTSKNVLKYTRDHPCELISEHPDPVKLFYILDDLANRVLSGNAALDVVSKYALVYPLILKIIDKNLEIRLNVASINKVIPGLIPVFQPVLANKYNPDKIKLDSDWYISRKLDGVRCIIRLADGVITMMSRTGKVLHNLDTICKPLSSYKGPPVFLDGELVSTRDGIENFSKTVSIVRSSKTVTDTSELLYKVFDMIPEHAFLTGTENASEIYSDRYERLTSFVSSLQGSTIRIVEQVRFSIETFQIMTSLVSEMSWEGLMLRKNVKYRGKRNDDLLKVKQFLDSEFKVLDTITGNIRMINNITGLEDNVDCVSAVVIKNKNSLVKVGSGFTQQQRCDLFAKPDMIIGKYITVKYFEETPDGSLRFPIFIGIRDYE
jgi:DNA ligase 1